jgi:hypothetical protein
MSDDDRSARASDRARRAAVRAAELRDRRERLAEGEPVTPEDVARATRAAERSAESSRLAHLAASQAEQQAAAVHRQAAETLDAHGRHGRAAAHRQQAEEDDLAAEIDRKRAEDSRHHSEH